MKNTVLFVVAVLAGSLHAERQPFERYQSIIDRQMFGALPPGFDPNKMPSEVSKAEQKELTQEQEKLQSSIHFSVINVTPEGETAVGFTDNSDPKTPVHYYLKVGEERSGWRVLEADAQAASMRIAKGDIEVSLTLGGDSANGGTTARTQSGSASAGPGRNTLLGGGSIRARRAQRERLAREEKEKAEAVVAEREAARQAQEAQERADREAERESQRSQLQAIQEELRRTREERERMLQEQREQRNRESSPDEADDAQ